MGKRGVIGIDVGGTKTLCILVDKYFNIVHTVKFKTAPSEGRARFSKRLSTSVRALASHARGAGIELAGIGIAAAGRVNPELCAIVEAPNIPFLEGYKIGRVLKSAVSLNSVIGNDVQCALYGEHQLGVARDYDHVLGVFFGTGVGGAAIINGKLYRGASDRAGQVGATLTHSIGGAGNVESHGNVDRIASKAALAGAAIGLGVKQWAPHLFKEVGTDISKVSWGALARARKAGDKQIDDLIRGRLRVVGIALSSIVNFLHPQMLVLGGGLTEELPRLVVSSVETGLREYLMPDVARKLKVKAARFGNHAGALGAARKAFEEFC